MLENSSGLKREPVLQDEPGCVLTPSPCAWLVVFYYESLIFLSSKSGFAQQARKKHELIQAVNSITLWINTYPSDLTAFGSCSAQLQTAARAARQGWQAAAIGHASAARCLPGPVAGPAFSGRFFLLPRHQPTFSRTFESLQFGTAPARGWLSGTGQ